MQFWIGLLIGGMIGASVGLLALAWLHAARRAEEPRERGVAARPATRAGRLRPWETRVIDLPRSVSLTSLDSEALRGAAATLEQIGNNDEARRLREIASRADVPEEARPLRRG